MRFHAFASASGKENLPAEIALVSHETLDCDSRKWESVAARLQRRLPGRRRFGGLFLSWFAPA
jgi:hypothetical protein